MSLFGTKRTWAPMVGAVVMFTTWSNISSCQAEVKAKDELAYDIRRQRRTMRWTSVRPACALARATGKDSR